MSRYADAGHLRSWAGLCPRLEQSAGKSRSARLRRGGPWLKPVPLQCAWAAIRARNRYLQAQFFRSRARRGPKKAVAIAASVLTAAFRMLRDRTEYRDLEANHLADRDRTRMAKHLANRLRTLGFTLRLQAPPVAAS